MENMKKNKAPLSIKIVSVFYILTGILSLSVYTNRELIQSWHSDYKIPDFYIYWNFISASFSIIAAPFLWRMKIWAGYSYFVLFVSAMLVSVYLWKGISPYDLTALIPLFFIYKNLPKMK